MSVVIPTLNAAEMLRRLALRLLAAASWRSSSSMAAHRTRRLRLPGPRARGSSARRAGAARSLRPAPAPRRATWLLFLHADCRLTPGWETAAQAFADAAGSGGARRLFRPRARRPGARGAAAGADRRLALPRAGAAVRRPGAADRAHALRRGRRLCGDPADGGCRPGAPARPRPARRRSAATIIASARRYRDDGYVRRPLRNLLCLSLYFAGVPPRRIARLYG